MDFSFVLFLIIAAFLSMGVGATTASNCFATTFGSGVLSYRKSILLVILFSIVGAVFQGERTTETIGRGLADISSLPLTDISAMMLGAAALLFLYAFYGIPTSTTQTVVGSFIGILLLKGIPINWGMLFFLFIFWVLTPFIAILFGMLSYSLLSQNLKQKNFITIERNIKWLVIGSMIFFAYSFGANNIGLIAGFIIHASLPFFWMALLSAMFIGVGSIFFSKRITLTTGKKITEIDPRMAFSSQTGSAITLYGMTLLGVPTSATQATIGGITGTGLVKSMALIDVSQLWKILRGWILTPILGAIFGVLSFFLLQFLV